MVILPNSLGEWALFDEVVLYRMEIAKKELPHDLGNFSSDTHYWGDDNPCESQAVLIRGNEDGPKLVWSQRIRQLRKKKSFMEASGLTTLWLSGRAKYVQARNEHSTSGSTMVDIGNRIRGRTLFHN
jgi:hypothetical protein